MIKIRGRPISKKRSYRRGKGNSFYLDKRYKEWEESALWQLKAYREHWKGLVHIDYVFQMKGKLDSDMDNMRAGINDILEKAGIIENDKKIVSDRGAKYHGFKDWVTLITIKSLEGKK